MGESALLRRSRCPIFTLHYAIVGCWAAERDPISLIIRSHASECTAARHQSIEVIDMRWFQIRPGRLIVTSVFVQPRNGVRIGAPIRGRRILQRAECGQDSCRSPERAELQKTSAPPNRERFRRESVHSKPPDSCTSQPTQQDSTPKALYSVVELPSSKYCHGLPTQTVCNSLDALLLQIRDTDLMWIVGLRLETKSARSRM